MKGAFLRNLSLYSRYLLYSPPKSRANPNTSFALFVSCLRSRFIFYSSESDLSGEAKLPPTQKSNSSVKDGDDVSNQELKKQIEKYYEGDDEAIPSIFEAILKRKLSGINDDKLMQELGLKPRNEDVTDGDSDSDSDSDFDDEEEKD